MAKTSSTMMLPLGADAPDFELADPSGKTWSLGSFEGYPVLLVAFLSNHCPFVKHIREGLARLVKEYQAKGVAAVGIMSNDYENYPDDRPEKMADEVKNVGYTFPYVVDESQEVAKAYKAACTPDFYVFDKDRKLVYCGQMDSSRPENGVPVTGKDLRAALDAVLEGKPVSKEQMPSLGCNIKWRAGSEPDYFKS
jgi:peroxiredoxin